MSSEPVSGVEEEEEEEEEEEVEEGEGVRNREKGNQLR